MLKSLSDHSQWLLWGQENILRGCDPKEIFDTLIGNGFDSQSIQDALSKPHVLASSASLASIGSGLSGAHHTELLCQVLNEKMELYLIPDFLSPVQCQGVIDLGRPVLEASTISLPKSQALSFVGSGEKEKAYVDLSFRTSRTSDLGCLLDPLVQTIDAKICQTLGVSPARSEGTQLQHYAVGCEFKAHTDYFEPQTDEYRTFASHQGNRTWTFMVYINEVEEGGETEFLEIQKVIRPQRGMAVIWNNLRPNAQVNPHTIHAGRAVTKGEKFVITKWFRER